MCLSLLPHVLQPATLHDAGECGTGLRQHVAWAAHRRCARARQAHGSRPETSSRTRLHPSQDVPVFARTQSERNPAQARACSSRGFGESTWRRWRGRMPAWSKWPGSQQPMRHPTATEARPCPPACPGPRSPPPFGLQPGSPRGLDAEEGLWLRRSGAGPKSPVPPPLAIQVRGVVRRACRASPRAGGVAGSRVHAQQRRSEHRVAVRSGRRVRVNQKCSVFYSSCA
jgi:hypothetical protein